jgi:uncharacterized FlaG/YvyC family protein
MDRREKERLKNVVKDIQEKMTQRGVQAEFNLLPVDFGKSAKCQ